VSESGGMLDQNITYKGISEKDKELSLWIAWWAMLEEYKRATTEFDKIYNSWTQHNRNTFKGRLFMGNLRHTVGKTDRVFYDAVHDFINNADMCNRHVIKKSTYVAFCIKALSVFVTFLVYNPKKHTGLDGSIRDIYSNKYPQFRAQWTRLLRSMVTWVRKAYPEEADWVNFLNSTPWKSYNTESPVDWNGMLRLLEAAEAELKKARPPTRTARGGRFVPQKLTSELRDAELLVMRDVLAWL
jgi:hypothetical protein